MGESGSRGPSTGPPTSSQCSREHGVVDAGGYGLLLLVAGILAGLRGERAGSQRGSRTTSHRRRSPRTTRTAATGGARTSLSWERGSGAPGIRLTGLEELGDSVMVVGDSATRSRVHIHTNRRDQAKALLADLGEITHEDHADMRRADRRPRPPGSGARPAEPAWSRCRRAPECGSSWRGSEPRRRRRSDDEPLADELLAAIEDLGAEEAVIVPPSRNVILAAQQAAGSATRRPRWCESTSQQAALVAMVEFERGASRRRRTATGSNAALEEIGTGAVAPAARDAEGALCPRGCGGVQRRRGGRVGRGGLDARGDEGPSRRRRRDHHGGRRGGAPIPLGELERSRPGVELEVHGAASRTTGGCSRPSDRERPAPVLWQYGLPLQREGALGTRLQGHPPPPPPSCRRAVGTGGSRGARGPCRCSSSTDGRIGDSTEIIAALEER